MKLSPDLLISTGLVLIALAVVGAIVWGVPPFGRTLHLDDVCPGMHPCEDRRAFHTCCVEAVQAERIRGIGWAEAFSACSDLADTVPCGEAE